MPKRVEKSKRGRGISTKNPKVNPFGNVWVRYRQALVHNGWYMIGKVPMYQLDMIYALQEWGGSMTSKMSTCGYVPNLCPRGTFTFLFFFKKVLSLFGIFFTASLSMQTNYKRKYSTPSRLPQCVSSYFFRFSKPHHYMDLAKASSSLPSWKFLIQEISFLAPLLH